MLPDLREPLVPGETITITLGFQAAGELVLEVPVRVLTAAEGGQE